MWVIDYNGCIRRLSRNILFYVGGVKPNYTYECIYFNQNSQDMLYLQKPLKTVKLFFKFTEFVDISHLTVDSQNTITDFYAEGYI